MRGQEANFDWLRQCRTLTAAETKIGVTFWLTTRRRDDDALHSQFAHCFFLRGIVKPNKYQAFPTKRQIL